MKPYPSYRPSGVDWLGEVPEGWEVKRLRQVIDSIESGTSVNASDYPASESEIAVLKTSCVYSGAFDAAENKVVLPEELERVSCPLKAGSLIVSRMNTPDLVGSAGYVTRAADNIFLPDRLWQVTFSGLNPRFAHYWTLSPFYRDQVRLSCAGTSASMQNLSQDDFKSFLIPLPPLAEQRGIAGFLGREVGKIDALIAEQRQLIALLAEKRQATISAAVTRGLSPDAPLKPSGVDGLGDIPEGWEVVRLKADLAFLTSGSRGWADYYSDEGAVFLRIGNLTREETGLDLSDIRRVVVPAGVEGERTRVQSGDVLFSITAFLGSVAVVPNDFEEAYVSQHVALARLKQNLLLPEWVAFSTLSIVGKTYLASMGYGGTKVQLSLDDIANLIVPTPSIPEQEAILSKLKGALSQLDALTTTATEAIALLLERRAALISAAVTGKIDVQDLSS